MWDEVSALTQNMKNIPTPSRVDSRREVVSGLEQFFKQHFKSLNVFRPNNLDLETVAMASIGPAMWKPEKPLHPHFQVHNVKEALEKVKLLIKSPMDRDNGRLCVT